MLLYVEPNHLKADSADYSSSQAGDIPFDIPMAKMLLQAAKMPLLVNSYYNPKDRTASGS